MNRISKSEAATMRDSLTRWHSVRDMQKLLQDMSEPVGFYAVSQGAMQFWREAWCACRFGALHNAAAVRLCKTDPPDFELQVENTTYPCELVEVRNPAARINDEFDAAADRSNAGKRESIEAFDTEAHLTWLPSRLSEVVSNKAQKGYSTDTILAVYIHAWIFDGQRRQTEETIWRAIAPNLDHFASIWVLSSGRLLTFSAKRSRVEMDNKTTALLG